MNNKYPLNRPIGEEPILPKTVPCTVRGKYIDIINCQHWEPNVFSCVGSCKINAIENPKTKDCVSCDKRKSFSGLMQITQSYKNAPIEIIPLEVPGTMPLQKNKTFKNPNSFIKKEALENQLNQLKKELPEEKEKTLLEKARTYLTAESSQAVQGKVSQKVFEYRKNICMTCEFRIEKPKNGIEDSIGWCKGGCGCTVGNPRAALSQKLYMPTLSCPKNKFGPSKGEGFNVSDAVDSAKSVVKSVVNLFTEKKDS